MVASLLEQRQRRLRERLELVDVGIGSERAAVRGDDSRKRLARLVAGRRARSAAASASAAARWGSAIEITLARSSSRWTSSRTGRVSSSARSSREAAAGSSPRQSARRPAAASWSPARSASAASGRPSSAW